MAVEEAQLDASFSLLILPFPTGQRRLHAERRTGQQARQGELPEQVLLGALRLLRSPSRWAFGAAMSWLRPAAFVLLLSAALLALQGPYQSLCSASGAAEGPASTLEVEVPVFPVLGEDASAGGAENERTFDDGGGEYDLDGFSRDSAGGAIDRPRDERPRTTKRLYTTRRTKSAASNQQLAKLKLAALGAVVLIAVFVVAFRGKFANDDDDDDS
ncbi:hypothetical protein Esti_006184 [Eimeria stiedai]